MRISFDNTASLRTEQTKTSYSVAEATRERAACGYKLDISDKVTDNAAYDFFGKKGSRCGQGRSAEEIARNAGYEDVTLYRNYMAVMSNSMSDEDFAKLQKEGYNPSDMEIEDAVTILDTIKAELLKAGVEIVGYTDSVDSEVLTEITGNEAYARQLSDAFLGEDVPVTEDNVKQAFDAFAKGKELTELTEGSLKYMVTNQMEPEIENLYLASHAGAKDAARQGNGYFSEEMPGYFAQKASETDITGIQEQIDRVIEKAGYPVTEENRQDGAWLIEKGVPLTQESFSLLKEIKAVKLPVEDKDLFSSIAAAVAEGKPAMQANLSEQKSVFRKAADTLTNYEKQYEDICSMPDTPQTAKARRQLEEIRLQMTVEANVKLLKSGFSIDTAPMEEVINALKQLEENTTDTGVISKLPVSLCRETLEKTREIPNLPAAALANLISENRTLTVDSVYETGKRIEETLKQAGEAYETMMTSPRSDLGDNIRSAFRNVDALLENMGQELTDENRKAVRSLSYNQTELTEENLLAVKGADRVVRRVVEKMTPSAVLSMIREGINPLTTSMEELDNYLTEADTYQEDSEKYSRFLYKMEQNHEITEEEKASYIGIYRLLRQIEKSDGAALGKLVETGAEVTFSNLLSAVRTGKIKGIDVSVKEEFGSIKEVVINDTSIDSQIDAAYRERQLQEIRGLKAVEDDSIRQLKRLELPVTLQNLLAADGLRKNGADSFKKIRNAEKKLSGQSAEEQTLEGILNETGFGEEETETVSPYENQDSMRQAYEELITRTKNLAQTLSFSEGMESLDVRALKLACKQLSIQGACGVSEQEYDVPQLIDGEMCAVHLKLVHDSRETGRFFVGVDTTRYGYLSGEFSMDGETVSGFFAGEGGETAEILKKAVDNFSARLENNGLKKGSIQVVKSGRPEELNRDKGTKTETKNLYRAAGMVIGALKESL